jgi:hypothetical protein
MNVKLSIQIDGATGTLRIDRVIPADVLLQSVIPAVMLSTIIDNTKKLLLSPNGDNATEQVLAFLQEEREIAALKKATDEATAKLNAALDKKIAASKQRR